MGSFSFGFPARIPLPLPPKLGRSYLFLSLMQEGKAWESQSGSVKGLPAEGRREVRASRATRAHPRPAGEGARGERGKEGKGRKRRERKGKEGCPCPWPGGSRRWGGSGSAGEGRGRGERCRTCLAKTAMSSLKESEEQTSPPATPGSRGVQVASSHFSKTRAKRGNNGCLPGGGTQREGRGWGRGGKKSCNQQVFFFFNARTHRHGHTGTTTLCSLAVKPRAEQWRPTLWNKNTGFGGELAVVVLFVCSLNFEIAMPEPHSPCSPHRRGQKWPL